MYAIMEEWKDGRKGLLCCEMGKSTSERVLLYDDKERARRVAAAMSETDFIGGLFDKVFSSEKPTYRVVEIAVNPV
jgi:hypothetical protein